MQSLEIDVITSAVGDRYVIQKMRETDCIIGGEQSGHLIFVEHNTTGDGLVAALQVLSIMLETDSKLSDLAAVYQKYPQTQLNIGVVAKPALESLPEVQKAIMDAESKLGNLGRILVRYSGTENLCRVMVEGPTQKVADENAGLVGAAIRSAIGKTA